MINLSLSVVLSELSKFYNVKVLLSVAWSFLRIGLPPNTQLNQKNYVTLKNALEHLAICYQLHQQFGIELLILDLEPLLYYDVYFIKNNNYK